MGLDTSSAQTPFKFHARVVGLGPLTAPESEYAAILAIPEVDVHLVTSDLGITDLLGAILEHGFVEVVVLPAPQEPLGA